MDPTIVRNLIGALKTSIIERKVDATSAFAIIVRGMELLENYKQISGQHKKEYILAVVEDLAKGPDGIAGTKDDLLPQTTVNALNALVRENILGNFVNIITDATKGKLNVNKAVSTTVSCMSLCFTRKY